MKIESVRNYLFLLLDKLEGRDLLRDKGAAQLFMEFYEGTKLLKELENENDT